MGLKEHWESERQRLTRKARGNVGTALIAELLKTPESFTIIAVSRSASSYTPPPGSNITVKTVDYSSSDSLKETFTGQDAVVNCITGGATQYEPSKLIIDAAVAAGVPFYFSNEFVGNMESEQFKRLPESAAGAKLRIRDYLGKLSAETKITWTALNGGPFFDMCKSKSSYGGVSSQNKKDQKDTFKLTRRYSRAHERPRRLRHQE